jgi:hypothetical protein
MTEAPCDSSVLWIILSDTMTMSQRQLNYFPQRLLNNYRTTQKRAGRDIRISFTELPYTSPKTKENQGEDQLAWSVNVDEPSFSVNGIVIDHTAGIYSGERFIRPSNSSEISRLTSSLFNKMGASSGNSSLIE